jgi:type I restriction enzyme M protein
VDDLPQVLDDQEQEFELLDDKYRSPIPAKLRWRNWAADAEGVTGDELLDFVNNQLFRGLKNLSNGNPRALVIAPRSRTPITT